VGASTRLVGARHICVVFRDVARARTAHSIVARARGLRVHSITLFALGGVANIKTEASNARTEFLVAVVGPVVSLTIGALCIGVAQSLGWAIDDGSARIIGFDVMRLNAPPSIQGGASRMSWITCSSVQDGGAWSCRTTEECWSW
jgi:Zn-dependent protease